MTVTNIEKFVGNDTVGTTFTVTDSLTGALDLTGGTGDDTFTVGAVTGAVSLAGGAGDDVYTVKSLTNVTINDTAGTDTLELASDFTDSSVNLATNTSITGIEVVDASAVTGDLALTGNATAATTFKLGGVGEGVSVSATGGSAADTFELAAASTGTLKLDGGNGTDTVVLGAGYTGTFAIDGTDIKNIEVVDASSVTGSLNITGTAAAETITGAAGGGTIDGKGGADVLAGGNGDNLFKFYGGGESVTGGTGTDTLELASTVTGSVSLDGTTLSGIEVVDASAVTAIGGVSITGNTSDATTFVLGAGAATVTGGDGTDTLELTSDFAGDSVALTATGGQYNSIEVVDASAVTGSLNITGTAAAETITGAAGGGTIDGKGGADVLAGGNGDNLFKFYGGGESVTGGTGTDTLELASTVTDSVSLGGTTLSNIEVVDASAVTASGGVSITGNAETATTFVLGAGAATVTGGEGTDTLELTSGFTGTSVTLAASDGQYNNIEVVDASAVATAVSITGLAEVAETITGAAGGGTIDGKGGADVLAGGAGNDTFMFYGSETVTGGDGTDTLKLASTVTGTSVDLGATSITGIDVIDASAVTASGGVTLTGNTSDATTFVLGAGAATVTGGTGDDTLELTSAFAGTSVTLAASDGQYNSIEVVDASAATSVTSITGNETAATTFVLGAVSDARSLTVTGGEGADTFTLGKVDTSGAVSLTGGAGADIYNLDATGYNNVTITDAAGDDADVVNFFGVDDIDNVAGLSSKLAAMKDSNGNISISFDGSDSQTNVLTFAASSIDENDTMKLFSDTETQLLGGSIDLKSIADALTSNDWTALTFTQDAETKVITATVTP